MALYFDSEKRRWRVMIRLQVNNQRIRKTKLLPPGINEEEARAIHDKMEADATVRDVLTVGVEGWPEYVESLYRRKNSWLHKTVARIRRRAKAKDMASTVTADVVRDLLVESRGRCAVTGIAFHARSVGARRPFMHSIDRIDSEKGYVPGNLRVVCYAVNVAMLEWGESVFAEIATGYIVNRYCALGLVAKMRA